MAENVIVWFLESFQRLKVNTVPHSVSESQENQSQQDATHCVWSVTKTEALRQRNIHDTRSAEHMASPMTKSWWQHWEIQFLVAAVSVRNCALLVKLVNSPYTIREQTTSKALV